MSELQHRLAESDEQAIEPMPLLETRTQEQIDGERYKSLGVEISNLIKERDALKAEMLPNIEAGVRYEAYGQTLVQEFQTRTEFEWERFLQDNNISAEAAKPYFTTKVVPVLNFRAIKAETAYDRYLALNAENYERYKAEKAKEEKQK